MELRLSFQFEVYLYQNILPRHMYIVDLNKRIFPGGHAQTYANARGIVSCRLFPQERRLPAKNPMHLLHLDCQEICSFGVSSKLLHLYDIHGLSLQKLDNEEGYQTTIPVRLVMRSHRGA